MLPFVFSLVLFALTSSSGAQTCYYDGGSIDTASVPCSDASNSPTNCCASDHVCLSNGLCYTPQGMTIYRGSCTDKTFESSACGQYCLGYFYSGLWPCDGSSHYACNLTGCAAGQSFEVAGSGGIVLNAALSSQLGISGATATTTVTQGTGAATTVAITTVTTDPLSDSVQSGNKVPSSQVTAVGAGVGVPLGLALLVALGLLWREHARYKNLVAAHGGKGEENRGGYMMVNPSADGTSPHQRSHDKKQTSNPAVEAPGGSYGGELDNGLSSNNSVRPTPHGGRFHEVP